MNLSRTALLLNVLQGCAVGDALGHPYEFDNPSQREVTGSFAANTPLLVTDDTQLTLFTLEGMITAGKGATKERVVECLRNAYVAWYHTQYPSGDYDGGDSWLYQQPELHYARAPGATCLNSLRQVSETGAAAPNDRKGNGANMRVAPLAFLRYLNPDFTMADQVWIAQQSGLITHKHQLVGDVLRVQQYLMAALLEGMAPAEAQAQVVVSTPWPSTISCALRRAATAEGWLMEEALAIAWTALKRTKSFTDGLIYCITRKGDSDTIAAIYGGFYGLTGAPVPATMWNRVVERRVIESMSAKASSVLFE